MTIRIQYCLLRHAAIWMMIGLRMWRCDAFAAAVGSPQSFIKPLPFAIHTQDQETMQRGARVYMNYCSGCHSLKYLRYNHMAQALGLTTQTGAPRTTLMRKHLQWTSEGGYDPVVIAMPPDDAQSWFGVAPPDLSLIMRSRGPEWVYAFLLNYYEDPKRPFHANNLIFPEVGMPNVLYPLQGRYLWNPSTQRLVQVEPGQVTREAFKQSVADLVQFLVWVGEPVRDEREHLGWWVLVFFLLLLGLYGLYLKNIDKD